MWKVSSWLFFLCIVAVSQTVIGQDYVDLFRVQGNTSPQNSFVNDTTSGYKNSGTNIEEFGIDLTLPIKLNEKFVIITGLSYDHLSLYTYPENLTVDFERFNMHTLKAGLSWQHNDTWSGQYLVLPKTTGNLKAFNKKNTQLAGLALLKQKKKENLFFRYGLYYNSEVFGPFFVPLLGIWYRSPNKKFEMNWTLPVWADMNYTWKKWFTTGMNFSAFVRSFYIPQQGLQTNNPPANFPAEQYMVKASNELFLYTQFNIKKSFLIQTKVGHSIGRSFRQYEYGDRVDWGFSAFRFGGDRTQLNPDLKDGLIFQVRLIYRYWIKEEEADETARLF